MRRDLADVLEAILAGIVVARAVSSGHADDLAPIARPEFVGISHSGGRGKAAWRER